MSDLKHKTADELREELVSLSRYRSRLESDWLARERQAKKLIEEAIERRQKHHNAGQREAWARIYLARKT